MGKEIPYDTRFRAEELYIFEQMTFESVAEATGISVTQLKRWAADEGWADQKREYRQAMATRRRQWMLLQVEAMQQGRTDMDPKLLNAISRMQEVAHKIELSDKFVKNAAAHIRRQGGEPADGQTGRPSEAEVLKWIEERVYGL